MIELGSAPFLVFALRHPLLDELLDECGRQRLVQRKVDRSFGGGETFQFLLKCADDRGSGEQTAVVRKRGKPHQHYSVSKGRNSITNDLGSFRRDSGPNRCAHFEQCATCGFRDARQVFLDVFRSAAASGRGTSIARFSFFHTSNATRNATSSPCLRTTAQRQPWGEPLRRVPKKVNGLSNICTCCQV